MVSNTDPVFIYSVNTLFIICVCFAHLKIIAVRYYLSWLLGAIFCAPTLNFAPTVNATLTSVTSPHLQPCHWWPLSLSLCLSLSMTSADGLCMWQPRNSWTSYMVAEGSQSKCLREASSPASPIWFSLESHLVQLLPYFTYHVSHKWSGIRTANIDSTSWLKECQRNCRHILKPPWPPLLLQPIWNTNSPYFLVWKILSKHIFENLILHSV